MRKRMEATVYTAAAACLRCDHQWWKRGPGRPERCPNCGQKNWDRLARKGNYRRKRPLPKAGRRRR